MDSRFERAWQVLQDPANDVRARLEAAELLGTSDDDDVRKKLREFLDRKRPEADDAEDVDPRVAERLCDMAVVGALHQLGADAPLDYLFKAIAAGTSGFGQPIREYEYAAKVIRRMELVSAIPRLIEMTSDPHAPTVRSAVRVLVALELPDQATHQPIPETEPFTKEFDVRPKMLAAYFEEVAADSKSMLVLSADAKALLRGDDYKIAEGDLEQTTLTEVLTTEAPLYKLAYFIQRDSAVLCTFNEAANRWREWGRKYADHLSFDNRRGRFIIAE